MMSQDLECTDASKQKCPVSEVENVENITDTLKEGSVAKPVEDAVAPVKSRLAYKVLGAVVVILFIVLGIWMLAIGSTFAATARHNTTGSKMFEKVESLHESKEYNWKHVYVTLIVVLGAIGSIVYFVKKRQQEKKAA